MTTTSSPARAAETTSASTRIRTLGAAMVIALLAQFLVGMANTFWLTVPESGPAGQTASPAGLLMAHVTLGFALPILAVWIAVVAVRARDRAWMVESGIGLAGIIVAFGGGSAFLNDVSNDGASFLMAVGCAVAIGAYAFGLYRAPSAKV